MGKRLRDWEGNFGFLPIGSSRVPFCFRNDILSIEPLPDYDKRSKDIDSLIYEGYIYRPVQVDIECAGGGIVVNGKMTDAHDIVYKTQCDIGAIQCLPQGFSIVDGSERQATLILPTSHKLIIFNNREKDPRHGVAAFAVHLAGFVFGTRLQFEEWWIDGKVPIGERQRWALPIFKPDIANFFDRALRVYTNMSTTMKGSKVVPVSQLRRAFINALYMHGRYYACEFEWEKMLMEYMAFDALCYALGIYNNEAYDRFVNVYKQCGLQLTSDHRYDRKQQKIPSQRETVRSLIRLRNGLIHMAAWDGRIPGEAARDIVSIHAPYTMRRIVERIIVGAFIGENEFTKSDWTSVDRGPVFRVM